MASFLSLPAELQIEVFGYLDRVDIKTVRQVCRAFTENSSPVLFRRVLTAPRYRALGAFQSISQHAVYQNYVKEIVYDGSVYDEYLATHETEYHRQSRASFSWQSHARFKKYQELYEDQEEIRKSGILFHTFARALEWMPNVNSIVYSPGPRTIPLEVKDTKDILPRGAPTSSLYEYGDNFRPFMERNQHAFLFLIAALGEANYTGVRNFAVEAHDRNSPTPGNPLTTYIFDIPSIEQINAGQHLFRHIHRLDLPLYFRVPGGSNHRSREVLNHFHNFRSLLEGAQELRSLILSVEGYKPDIERMYTHLLSFGQSIGSHIGLSLTWPNLNTISLTGFHMRESELIDLMDRHRWKLRGVELRTCSLNGLWANVVDHVLQDTTMDEFYLVMVHEAAIGDHHFEDLPVEDGISWTYSGELVVLPKGVREFVPAGESRSVYARREAGSDST